MGSKTGFICPRCEVGLCRPGRVTYARVVAGQLLSVPNMRAFTCDVCGYREFEPNALRRLQVLMGDMDSTVDDNAPRAKPASLEVIDLLDRTTARRLKP